MIKYQDENIELHLATTVAIDEVNFHHGWNNTISAVREVIESLLWKKQSLYLDVELSKECTSTNS